MSMSMWSQEDLKSIQSILEKDGEQPARSLANSLRRDIDESIWNAILRLDAIDIADELISHSILHITSWDPSIQAIHPCSTRALAWIMGLPGMKELVESIDPTCQKEVLVDAACNSIPPAGILIDGTFFSGGEYIGNTLDIDVIRAYLEMGFKDGFDPSFASDNGRQDIVRLYKDHGIEHKSDTVECSFSYMLENGQVIIPEGIRKIATPPSFCSSPLCTALALPSTLEEVGDNAFRGVCGATLILPPSLKKIGFRSFGHVSSLEMEDQNQLTREMLVALRGCSHFASAGCDDCIIRSSETGHIINRIWFRNDNLPFGEQGTVDEIWGDCGAFHMDVVDRLYSLYTPVKNSRCGDDGRVSDKLIVAINRLRWPIDLDEKTARKYRTFVKKSGLEAIAYLAKSDDTDRLSAVIACGAITPDNITKAYEIARTAGALKMADQIQATDFNNTKSKAKKPTVAQLVARAADALDDGDGSCLAELEPIAARVPMADCVELLERAAANCDSTVIDKLYDLFKPFECDSVPLFIALCSGNVDTAKTLIKHGANLDGKLVMVDEKRTPASKLDARIKRYSHGLTGQKYSSGEQVARSLSEAIDKFDGCLAGHTKKSILHISSVARETAARTLIEVSHEKGFDSSIAIKLLWHLISFDGRQTRDARYYCNAARLIFDAGILSQQEISRLPWKKAVKGCMDTIDAEDNYDLLLLVKDYAPDVSMKECWRKRFGKPNIQGYSYDGPDETEMNILLFFVNLPDFDWCPNKLDVLTSLILAGEIDAFTRLAERPSWITKARIQKLLDAASESGQTEITAWLLAHSK